MLPVSLLFCLRFITPFFCLRPVSCVPNVASVPSDLSKVLVFFVFVLCRVCPMLSVSLLFCLRFIVFFCLRPVSCVPNVVSVPSVLSKVYCFFYCLRPVSCVPNVASVPSVLSKVLVFFLSSSCVVCTPFSRLFILDYPFDFNC